MTDDKGPASKRKITAGCVVLMECRRGEVKDERCVGFNEPRPQEEDLWAECLIRNNDADSLNK